MVFLNSFNTASPFFYAKNPEEYSRQKNKQTNEQKRNKQNILSHSNNDRIENKRRKVIQFWIAAKNIKCLSN